MNEELKIFTNDGETYFARIGDGEDIGPLKRIEENGRTIVLPKNNPTGRQYVAKRVVDTAMSNGDEFYIVPVRTAEHRSVSNGTISYHKPNEKLIAYLGEEERAEYNAIVDKAAAAMQADKGKGLNEVEKAKRALLIATAKLTALENGVEYVAPKFDSPAKKALVDYIADEDYPRYQELLDMAETVKANAPKPERAPRNQTPEQKIEAAKARIAKAQAALDALLAAEAAAVAGDAE